MEAWNDILQEFLADRKVAISKGTYDSYASKLNVIDSWVKENNISIDSWDDKTVSKFFTHLASERGLDKSTCKNYKIVLGVFFDFAVRWGYMTTKPSFDLVTFPKKKEDKGATVIAQPDLKKLLGAIEKSKRQLHLVMMTEYYCALRPGSEIRLMRAKEVDLNAGVIRIPPERAKSRRKEIVTMPEQLIDLYRDYLDEAKGGLYVFGKGGKPGKVPWSENTLRNQFNKYRDKLKLPKGYKLYSSKHTGITRLAESGMPLHIIMEHARHTNLSVTQAYIKRHGGLVDDRIRCSFPNP